MVEDLSLYLADFGVDATLNGQAVRVIFDNLHTDSLGVSTRSPRAGVPTEDAAGATRGSTLVIGAQTYKVRSVEPDGTGWTELALEI